jgi:hypothetical protein
MPKQIINLIGILVSVAILALGIFLVAMPLVTQGLAVTAQTQQVAQTNVLYQAQVDALNKAKANKAQTDAAVAALRSQIPATPQLDQVFDLVARASLTSQATITAVTAGTAAPFASRTDAAPLTDQKTAPAPSPSPTSAAGGAIGSAQQAAGAANAQSNATNQASGATGGSSGATGGSSAATGSGSGQTRTQIDFTIAVTAKDMNQVTAFLDALRAGPRLLSNITSTVKQGGSDIEVDVTALTYVDGAPVPVTEGAKK